MRLIDADALNEVVDRCMKTTYGKSKEYNTMMFYEIFDFIDNVPTIDAVEVTRCNECRFGYPRFWASYGEYRCQRFRNDIFKGDHFCAWGEPRPEDIEL